MSLAEKVAQPGDPDLDCDITGLRVRSVVAVDGEFLVDLDGGSGHWLSGDGMVDADDVIEVRMTFGFPRAPETTVATYLRFLEHWRAEQTPLRLVRAPGRMDALIEDFYRWLPVPRTA